MICLGEFEPVFARMKYNKSVGADFVPTEVFKALSADCQNFTIVNNSRGCRQRWYPAVLFEINHNRIAEITDDQNVWGRPLNRHGETYIEISPHCFGTNNTCSQQTLTTCSMVLCPTRVLLRQSPFWKQWWGTPSIDTKTRTWCWSASRKHLTKLMIKNSSTL